MWIFQKKIREENRIFQEEEKWFGDKKYSLSDLIAQG